MLNTPEMQNEAAYLYLNMRLGFIGGVIGAVAALVLLFVMGRQNGCFI